jgi:hypothetical protein
MTMTAWYRRLPLGALAIMTAVACAPTPSTSLNVASVCPDAAHPYQETILSTATPARPRAGSTVGFELGVRRLQIDVGPLTGATYVFAVPAGVARIRAVEFADANPNEWSQQGDELTIEFRGPDGGWLVNDFPRMTITAELSGDLRAGDRIPWKPYLRFEQRFLNGPPLSCRVADPNQVLQTMVVRA